MPQLEASTYLSQFFWLITSFLTLWFFMAWFIIPKIEEVMEQRRRKIDDFVQKAEKINKQALLSLTKYEKALQKAKNEADILLEQNKIALQESVSKKHTELEDMLNKKIADTEYMLAKERQETLAEINEVANKIALEILAKIDIEIKPQKLEEIALRKK